MYNILENEKGPNWLIYFYLFKKERVQTVFIFEYLGSRWLYLGGDEVLLWVVLLGLEAQASLWHFPEQY